MTSPIVRAYFEAHVMEPTDGCRFWPYSTGGGGYGKVVIDGKFLAVPTVTCERWYGPKPTPAHEAAHSCGKPLCWSGEHMSWKTRAENAADRLIHGTDIRGSHHFNAKLNEDDVREIKQRLLNGDKGVLIAKDYNVSQTTISDIKVGRRWGWLE